MKTILCRRIFLTLIFLAAVFQLRAQQPELHAPDIITPRPQLPPNFEQPNVQPSRLEGALIMPVSSQMTPQAVLGVMQRVADWQLAHPSVTASRPATGWVQAAGDAGMMALAGISGDARYRDAVFALGETNNWKLGARLYDADDHCIGQIWAELYLLYRQPEMIAPLREKFDAVLANPSKTTSLEFARREDPKTRENWAWCDSLFMGPPAWMRLYSATGDEKYMNYAVSNWWRTTAYLYDTNEHLFFRDSTYFNKREANGAKIFWGRGNGWVMAGLVRVLQSLPMNSPDRPRFEKLFTEMAGKILTCQQPDGLWRASLLDPDSYPLKETSGSGFYTYALAWGVNQGLLDRAKFEPAIRKAWTALVACVADDGKLTHVQPIGADPKKFADNSTEVYGTGAFLLAGSEVYRMAVLENAKPMVDHPSIPPAPPGHTNEDFTVTWERIIKVKVTPPSAFRRDCETVELNRYDKENSNLIGGVRFWPNAFTGSMTNANIAVMDGVSSRILDSQEYEFENDVPNHQKVKLLFQVDLAPSETRTFYILDSSALAAVPPPIVKTSAPENPSRRFPAPRDPPLQVTIGN